MTNWLCNKILVAQSQEGKIGCNRVETSKEGWGSEEGYFAIDND
jgi:hypothetical protein